MNQSSKPGQDAAKRTDAQPVGTAWGHPAPWSVEAIGRWVRVVDAHGGDVLLVGDVHTPGVRALAQRIAEARGK